MSKIAKRKHSAGKSRWELAPIPAPLVKLQGLPEQLPAPPREADRLLKGAVPQGELAKWTRRYCEESELGEEENTRLLAVADHLEQFQAASDALAAQSFQDAGERFAAITTSFPEDKLATLNLAQCRNILGEAKNAIEMLDSIAEDFEGNIRYIVIRSRVLQNLNRRDEMVKLLEESWAKAPNNKSLRQELIRAGELVPAGYDPNNPGQPRFIRRTEFEKLMIGKIDEMLAGNQFEQAAGLADFHLESNMPQSAFVLAERILAKNPEQTGALTVAGFAKARLGQEKEAIEFFEKAVALVPDHPKAQAGLGGAYLQAGETDKGREILNAALAKNHNDVRAAEVLVLSYDEGKPRIDIVNELREKYPDAWVPVKLLGDLEFREGNITTALELHRTAFDRHPADDTVTMVLHDLDRLGRIEEAVKFAETIPSLDRRSASVRWNTANIYLKGGRVKPAVAILQKMANDGRLPFETRHSASLLLGEIQANVRGRH